ncbi:MAG: hypothetical protein KF752_09845 [Pirellulaceae bacterium]|nr:hypothetical protein [Pirellulaceae bacterium]
MKHTDQQFDPQSFFRHPEWRRARAEDLVRSKTSRGLTKEDPLVVRYVRFLKFENRLIAANYPDYELQRKLMKRDPILHFADEFYRHRNTLSAISLQGHLLTELTIEEIAERFGRTPEIIETYSKLFWDVRDHLDNIEYIAGYVIGPVFQFGIESINAPLMARYFGYFGGPLMLRHVLYGLTRTADVNSDDEVLGYLESAVDKNLRLQAAIVSTLFQPSKYDLRSIVEGFVSLRKLDRERDNGTLEQNWVAALVDTLRSMRPIPRGSDERNAYMKATGIDLDGVTLEPRSSTKQQMLENPEQAASILQEHRDFKIDH